MYPVVPHISSLFTALDHRCALLRRLSLVAPPPSLFLYSAPPRTPALERFQHDYDCPGGRPGGSLSPRDEPSRRYCQFQPRPQKISPFLVPVQPAYQNCGARTIVSQFKRTHFAWHASYTTRYAFFLGGGYRWCLRLVLLGQAEVAAAYLFQAYWNGPRVPTYP